MLFFLFVLALTWSAIALVFIGLGTLLMRAASGDLSELGIGERFWAGFAGAVGTLVVWNLFRPVNASVNELLLLLGLAGWVIDHRAMFQQARALLNQSRLEFIFFGLFTLVIGFAASGTFEPLGVGLAGHYDTTVYGAGTVEWFSHFAAVPGLANLHRRSFDQMGAAGAGAAVPRRAFCQSQPVLIGKIALAYRRPCCADAAWEDADLHHPKRAGCVHSQDPARSILEPELVCPAAQHSQPRCGLAIA
jgi:hypothetical protein